MGPSDIQTRIVADSQHCAPVRQGAARHATLPQTSAHARKGSRAKSFAVPPCSQVGRFHANGTAVGVRCSNRTRGGGGGGWG